MSGDGNGPPRADTLRVLLATDNHLGYAEKDPVRGDDSFRAFQEILQLARDERVDLLLLAGDLFHENKPSRKTLYQTMRLLRAYCMGDGAVQFQIVSDQSINFPNFGTVNYEDPNFNIELPVFSIHGNHDDPAREAGGAQQSQQSLAALDLLSAANLVNYFGKSEKADAIEVFPILMHKGATKVAVYGLGSMRDERLNRMFAQQKVVFRRPAENAEEWFSVFVVHQNRDDRGRGAKNCLPESFIPDFIDFVVWGHEHECLVDVQESLKGDFFITQPGSSVATSLVEGEAKTKQVAILEIHQQNFRLSSRVLKSVRPFKLGEISLSEVEDLDPDDPDVTSKIRDVLEERVLELIAQAEEEAPDRPPELKQVLVRVRVEHTGFPVLVNQRFGSRFVGKVANPNDILLFYRRKKKESKVGQGDAKDTLSSVKGSGLGGSLRDPIRPARLADSVTIEDLLGEQLRKPDQMLSFLPEGPLSLALEEYITKSIPSAIDDYVNTVLESTRLELTSTREAKSREAIIEAVEKKKDKADAEHLLQQEEAEHEGTQASSSGRRDGFQESRRNASQSQTQATQGRRREDSLDDNDDDEDMAVDSPPAKKTAARATSSRSTATKSKPAAKGKRAAAKRRDYDDDDEDEEEQPFSDDGDYDKRPSAASRKKKPVATPPARKTTARAASTKAKAKQRSMSSDEDVGGDDDGDEDYEMEDDSELVSQAPSTPVRRGRAAPAAKTAARKRLRKAESEFSDDDEDFSETPAPSRRAAPTPKSKPSAKKSAIEEVDLCSSDGEETARTKKPAARAKPTPQPKISDMFRKQQPPKKQDDDIESDPEFTQLTGATAATVGGGGRLGAVAEEEASEMAPSQSQFLSQFQSQASQSTGAKKRKLPLSMLTASQTTPASKKKDGGGDASALRKGWGRTRR